MAPNETQSKPRIGDTTWAELGRELDDAQLIEFIQLVGIYATTAWLQNSLRFRLRPGNSGLQAR